MNRPITRETERKIISALEKESHASRVARMLRDVSYATVWRVADRAGIELTAGREAKGRRLSPERRAKLEATVAANPEATQEELAQQCGVSRATVGRVVRGRRGALPIAE
jgi:CRP-like cAMP-binding protein